MRGSPSDFETRWQQQREEMERERATARIRAARFDRYLGWIFSLAFVLLLVLIVVGVAAVRWIWLACVA